jgi:hypothetical protein
MMVEKRPLLTRVTIERARFDEVMLHIQVERQNSAPRSLGKLKWKFDKTPSA